MELIDQHTKKIMEECKERARNAGLCFDDETLEYIVTNRDLLELSPKAMIPTLYDYWVHDVEVLKEKGRYELYPGNPFETVINTRPAISFYNDNNPDWLNVMIFYHVLAHIDFFQNNIYFQHTWDYDFTGQALSDKRLITKLRSRKGRWVDYIIEFTRGIDNLVAYYDELSFLSPKIGDGRSERLDFYFDIFLQSIKKVSTNEYLKEVTRYNHCIAQHGDLGEHTFFSDTSKKYPEFETVFKKSQEKKSSKKPWDLIQFLMEYSPFLNDDENKWMKSVMQVVRTTSIFFQPQMRTKIMNEGWASYWHETLFLSDDRITGHEVDFARINSAVTTMPRVGLNPYALGMQLFYNIEKSANKGKFSYEFQRIHDVDNRKKYDAGNGNGREFIFKIRENFSDFSFINTFIDQDFLTRNNLFVTGRRLNQARMVWEYFVKSRNVDDYRKMIFDSLYHPPHVDIDQEKTKNGAIYLNHFFEGKPLVKEFIHNTMLGIEFLWKGPVKLETSEVVADSAGRQSPAGGQAEDEEKEIKWQRVVYTMQDRKLSKKIL